MHHVRTFPAAFVAVLLLAGAAYAGPVFLTGHDPDFHAQGGSPGAVALLRTGLNYATGGTYNVAGHKFLWVESFDPIGGGHVRGEDALTVSLGLTQGVNFDWVDAAGLASVNLNNYTAIAIASDFGGMLTSAEINELIARKTDLQNFINSGHGLFAAAECGVGYSNCSSDNVVAGTQLFGYLPVGVTSVSTAPPYTVTPFGASLGLDDGDINDPTHNSFGLIGGLNVVDRDAAHIPTTLAGVVGISNNGFTPAPEPASASLLGVGLVAVGRLLRRRLRH